MNVRALALGALVGFVVAFAPACSPPKCGPQNCDGCCDSKGTCVKKPNNNNNTTCGSAGNACVDCAASASTCNSATSTCGTAVTGGGGGSTGGGTGGGTATCDGCRLSPTSCSPPQLSATSTTNCGLGGVACVMCGAGELCTNGVCGTPPSMKRVGDACLTDVECQGSGAGALGPTAICKQMTTSGNGTYAGGYCTVRCGTAGTSCPGGSTCVGLLPQYGEADTFCWDNCSGTDRCRTPGYECYQIGNGNSCWIDPIPPVDAGVPADKVGNACSSTAECINPPETGGVCLSREANYDWTAAGGYCSKTGCISNDECSADGGSFCIGLTEDDPNLCVQKCADSSDGGQSTCRNGFVCEGYVTRLADGGIQPSADGFCVPPPAPIPTSIGEACATNLDCSVPTGAIADCLPATLPNDAGPSGFTDGYCTRSQCQSDSDCSPDGGAQCFGIGGTNTACFRLCPASDAGQGTCRTGYVCESFGLGDGGQSTNGVCDRACNAAGAPACPTGRTCNQTNGYCE